jgi:hypothetical protein
MVLTRILKGIFSTRGSLSFSLSLVYLWMKLVHMAGKLDLSLTNSVFSPLAQVYFDVISFVQPV